MLSNLQFVFTIMTSWNIHGVKNVFHTMCLSWYRRTHTNIFSTTGIEQLTYFTVVPGISSLTVTSIRPAIGHTMAMETLVADAIYRSSLKIYKIDSIEFQRLYLHIWIFFYFRFKKIIQICYSSISV